ncbi:AAA family ATPase [Paraburkholderia phymatum]|uniref:trifunctional serine/threonine-protein kinase/ATP-binding protein/sensor histidine kinase n=1 Tax=Paraburkholderia phymatum TaxID=148447 RepID=UPI00316DD2F5
MNEPATLDMTLLRAGQIELYRRWYEGSESVLLATTSLDTASGKPWLLQSEHELKETLVGSWALQPLKLSHRLDQIQLTLSDPGGYVLRESCGAPVAIDQFLTLAIALARAVSAMHAQGIVHRDLSPENILFNWRAERAWLTGLGNAMVLGADHRSLSPLSSTSLHYLAPELCGTINRPVDARADLYSLGCVLYELTTGSPPVPVDDLPSAVHSHLAMLPSPASAVMPDCPKVLSQVIATLMAKDPNDRYSSADGLLGDLLRCHAAWREHSHLQCFPIDHANAARRLNASDRIYGRVCELNALRDAFEDVASDGRTRCVALFGGSGTGKSALVRCFERTLDENTHRFGAGKCGQVEDATPYGCLAMALRDLLHNKLREEGREFIAWSEKLRVALGSSIALLRTLLPDLSLIVEDLPHVTSSAAAASDQDRFFDAICKFIECFSTDQRPLVLFLDDLQWADCGTLSVAQRLLQAKGMRNLLLIFASRSEAMLAPQQVWAVLDCSTVPVTEITLGPMEFVDVNRLVSDILGCSPARSIPLSDLIQTKTGSNPFFVIRFMSMLLDEGLVWFDSGSSSWQWDLSKARSSNYTSNVAELLLDKLETLPVATLSLLRCMACLGDSSTVQILAMAAAIEEHSVHTLFDPAEHAGLVRWNASAYSFLHDRIREATYNSLVRDHRHKEMHITVGRRLARARPEQRELLFAAANQINLGAELIDDSDEKLRYARLNLDAAILAKKSADYRAAIAYLQAASFLLRDVEDLTIAGQIEFHRAECEFVTADLTAAEARLERLWSSDIDIVLKSSVTRLRAALYTTQGRQRVAVDIGLSYLAQLGIVVSGEPGDEDVERDRAKLIQYIDRARLESVAQRGAIASPMWAGAMDVLGDLILPALFCNNENLVDSLVFTMALMTVERGFCSASSYAFVHAAGILAYRFRDVERSLFLGEKALQLSSDEGFDRLAARVRMCFGVLVIPWTRPIRSAQRYIKDAVKAAYDSCDLTYAVYSKRNLVSNLLFVGAPLGEVLRATEEAVDFARSAGFKLVVDTILVQLMVASTLRGTYAQTFESRGLESDWSESLTDGVACTSTGAFAFWVHRLQLCVLFRDWGGALEAEGKATGLLGASLAHIETADLPYYGALCRAAAFFSATEEGAREVHLRALRNHHDYLQSLAESCPDNFGDRAALAAAELARVQGRNGDAQLLYEKAIDLARKQDFVHNEAVALEAAANFYSAQHLPVVAETLLRNARYAYLHWGAEGKAREVEVRMTRIIGRQRSELRNDTGGVHLDTRAVVTASHALSSEIVLPRLLEVLIGNVLEHAGAERCAVALHRKGEFRIEAEARASLDGLTYVIESRQLQEVELPLGIFMTVARTRQKVLLDNATRSDEFARDRDVIQRGLRSVLCMPLLKQSELVGILYVENNLISGAFTEEKTTLLEVFASQAAISLENARLYADTVRSNALREAAERELQDTREELARVASLTTMGQLVASIAHEVSQPLVSIATSAGAALRFMRRGEPDFVEVEDALKRIQFDSTRAHDVVRSLRALVKRSAPSFSAFDLHDAIEEVLLVTRSQLEKHAVWLDSNAISGTRLVWGDRVQIQQVVLNLIVNAIEAMHEIGDRERRLFLGSSAADGHVRLVIEDTGVGIEEGAADHIFAPFVTTKPHGMGMGLPICRSIVQAHAGRLTVERLNPYGTRFEVWLPEPGAASVYTSGPNT